MTDRNRITQYVYNADGRLSRLIAWNAVTGDQETAWEYGTTLAESGVASNGLVRAKVYPGGSQREEYEYNRLGEVIRMTDPNGTVHEYDRDLRGRLTADRVTALGSGVDGAVRQVRRSYNAHGLLETVSNSSDPSAEVVTA